MPALVSIVSAIFIKAFSVWLRLQESHLKSEQEKGKLPEKEKNKPKVSSSMFHVTKLYRL